MPEQTVALSIQPLAQAFRGTLIRPGDHIYDEARSVWNGMFDRHG